MSHSPEKSNVVPFAMPDKKLQVLVVDDEKSIADTLALILRAKGYKAASAYDGAAGLALYRRMVPDLVISDVVMPQMNGVDMAIAIRREFLRSRILLFSGQQTVRKKCSSRAAPSVLILNLSPSPSIPSSFWTKSPS